MRGESPTLRPRLGRILLSEGNTTSARQAITALALAGYEVEVCDPNPLCLGRFSRLITRFHRCPPLGTNPAAYLSFILALVRERAFEALIPIHEQGFLFSKAQSLLRSH